MLDHGLTCVVVGNGPSLNKVPVEWLGKYPTFGSNRCYLRFIPTYYVCVNPLVIEQNRAEIAALPCDKFIRAGSGILSAPLHSSTQAKFSFEPLCWIHEGYTVTYVSLQLAYWMGFKTVFLVGVDHRYQQTGKPNEQQVMNGDDPNHFDPHYFKGQNWNLADIEKSTGFYKVARDIYEKNGRKIINLTEGTALDVFEKGNIEEWTR